MPEWGQASFERADVVCAATIDLTDVTDRRVRITGATGPVTSILMNPWQMLDVEFASTPTLNHGVALDVAYNGNNRPVAANDTCTLAADASANVTIWNYQPHTTRSRLHMAAGGIIEWSGAGSVFESGDTLLFIGFAAGYSFDAPIIVAENGNCARFINDASATSAQVARFESQKNGTAAANDEAYISFYAKDNAGSPAQREFGRLTWVATDVASASIDGSLRLSIASNNALAEVLRLTGGGNVVNGVELVGAVSGSGVIARPFGTDADIGWTFASKGGGRISFGSAATQPTEINSTSITRPFAPAFQTRLNTSASNVTGNNTAYTIVYDTEITDRGSDLSGSTFTADVTGLYWFAGTVALSGLVAGTTTILIELVTSNRTYRCVSVEAQQSSETHPWSVLADVDAADTVTVRVTCNGNGSDNVSVVGNAAPFTYFAGNLMG